MRRASALGALVLVICSAQAFSAPSADVGLSVPALSAVEQAQAAIGRGGGGGEAGQSHVLSRTASWLQGELTSIFYVVVAVVLGVMAFKRDAGAAIAILIAALVIGAFLLVPDQVESFFRAFYQLVL